MSRVASVDDQVLHLGVIANLRRQCSAHVANAGRVIRIHVVQKIEIDSYRLSSRTDQRTDADD
jgi:hypothetical protein